MLRRIFLGIAAATLLLPSISEGQALRSRIRSVTGSAVYEGLALGTPREVVSASGTVDVLLLLAGADTKDGVAGGAGSVRWLRLTDASRANREIQLCTAISVTAVSPVGDGSAVELATGWHVRMRDVPFCAAAFRQLAPIVIASALRDHPEALQAFLGRGELFELGESLAEIRDAVAPALGQARLPASSCESRLEATRVAVLEWRVDVQDRASCDEARAGTEAILGAMRAIEGEK